MDCGSGRGRSATQVLAPLRKRVRGKAAIRSGGFVNTAGLARIYPCAAREERRPYETKSHRVPSNAFGMKTKLDRRWSLLIPTTVAILATLTAPERLLLGASASPKAAVIRNVNIVRMDNGMIEAGQTVIVRGNVIERIGPTGQIQAPWGSTIIEGRRKYLLPGLADMHAHLAEPNDPTGTAEAQLILFLANGVTTIRSMRGFPNHLMLRDSVGKGQMLGPTIIAAGPGLDGKWPKSASEAEAAVLEQKRQGYDLIKVLPGLTLPVFDAIARTANKAGIPFAGHVPADVGLLHALDMGQKTIEHLDGYLELLNGSRMMDPQNVSDVVRRTLQTGVWNVATMAVMETNLGLIAEADLLKRPELEYMPETFIKQWLRIRSFGNPPKAVSEMMHRNRMMLLKALRDSDARILFGTDSPQLFTVPGFSIHREMRLMMDAGLTPLDILRSATARVGEYTGRPCGEIKTGQCADLLLLDANPMKDLNNLGLVAGVMVKGRWLPAAELRRRLKAIRDQPGNYRQGGPAG
jgi:imidazolonepropionase-like amidohydrolase